MIQFDYFFFRQVHQPVLTEGMILDVPPVMIPELRGEFSFFTRIQLL